MSVHYGQGQHMDTIPPADLSQALKWTIAGFSPSVMTFGLPKLAVICLVSRLLNPSRLHAAFLWTLGGTTMASIVLCIAVLFGQCTPARAQWDLTVTHKTCLDKSVLVDIAIVSGCMHPYCRL